MRYTTIGALIALACTACSEGDLDIGIEKSDQDQQAATSTEPEQNRASQATAEAAPKASETAVVANNTNTEDTSMSEVEATLSAMDDSQALVAYGANGSSISISGKPIPLNIQQRALVSNVESIDGATALVASADGLGFAVTLSGDYLFEFDKDTLTPEAQKALESILALYKQYDGQAIQIVGHTDAKGSNQYNLDLSKRRAASVKNWFKKAGISTGKMQTKGMGESDPVAPNTKKDGSDNPEGRALNRRVDITIKTNKKVNHLPTVSKPSLIDS